jgi:hypothetical protein
MGKRAKRENLQTKQCLLFQIRGIAGQEEYFCTLFSVLGTEFLKTREFSD